ncbi:MAG: hypothetical protein RMK99_06010 [Anaerolineales bacterium]|nr:hypothetical protein [Anaerolineales bacterium]
MQVIAALSVGLMILLVVGGLYLAVASRAANAGRDLQRLEAAKASLLIENDRLRAQLAELRTMNRMAARALELGFVPAGPDRVEYVAVPNYPHRSTVVVEMSSEATPIIQADPEEGWLQRMLGMLFGRG